MDKAFNLKKSLEQIIMERKPYGDDDIDIIVRYFTENECYDEAVDLIVRLLKNRIAYQDSVLAQSRSWIPSLMLGHNVNGTAAKYNGKVIPRTTNEEQALYDRLTSYFLLDMRIPEDDLDEARKIIPNRTRPFMFYAPALEWLDKEYDIRFKED